ncbi:MAG: hypothetical protein H0S85_07660 [Desulfovibrionaceae bacterium]|nr:hypothetical protein [Desulfovibrionaceae bacterium]
MDEREVVRAIVEQARARCRTVSGELRPWSVMARGAESLEGEVRRGGDPLVLSLALLQAVLEGFPAVLPGDERFHRENCLHALADGLCTALRAARGLAEPDMDAMHKARLAGVAAALERTAASLLADPQGADPARLAWELTELAQVVNHAVRDVPDAGPGTETSDFPDLFPDPD